MLKKKTQKLLWNPDISRLYRGSSIYSLIIVTCFVCMISVIYCLMLNIKTHMWDNVFKVNFQNRINRERVCVPKVLYQFKFSTQIFGRAWTNTRFCLVLIFVNFIREKYLFLFYVFNNIWELSYLDRIECFFQFRVFVSFNSLFLSLPVFFECVHSKMQSKQTSLYFCNFLVFFSFL